MSDLKLAQPDGKIRASLVKKFTEEDDFSPEAIKLPKEGIEKPRYMVAELDEKGKPTGEMKLIKGFNAVILSSRPPATTKFPNQDPADLRNILLLREGAKEPERMFLSKSGTNGLKRLVTEIISKKKDLPAWGYLIHFGAEVIQNSTYGAYLNPKLTLGEPLTEEEFEYTSWLMELMKEYSARFASHEEGSAAEAEMFGFAPAAKEEPKKVTGDEDDEEDEKPAKPKRAKKSKASEDDEDEKPAKKGTAKPGYPSPDDDDEEDDLAPKSKKSKDKDDDED
jgi:hypothetical protein